MTEVSLADQSMVGHVWHNSFKQNKKKKAIPNPKSESQALRRIFAKFFFTASQNKKKEEDDGDFLFLAKDPNEEHVVT